MLAAAEPNCRHVSRVPRDALTAQTETSLQPQTGRTRVIFRRMGCDRMLLLRWLGAPMPASVDCQTLADGVTHTLRKEHKSPGSDNPSKGLERLGSINGLLVCRERMEPGRRG